MSLIASNLLSTTQNPNTVDIKLVKELGAQRFADPPTSPPFTIFGYYHLATCLRRLLGTHHLSYIKGSSLNDGISSENVSVSDATV